MATLRIPAIAMRMALGGLALTAATTTGAIAQTDSLTNQFTRYQRQNLQEKLFLHLDRPLYMSGELLWFKVYAVDATLHKPLSVSKVAYVEVLDETQRPVLQAKVALQNAAGKGSFVLPASLLSGSYTVRAYTSWMKNFAPEQYFQTAVRIVNPGSTLGLKMITDSLAVDARFFPEGGELVQGLPSTVGFKLTDKQGRSLAAKGTILDQAGVTVAQFATERFGLGRFQFTPKPGAAYTAVIELPNRRLVTQKLPAVQPQGYSLHVAPDASGRLSVEAATNVPGQSEGQLWLLAHAGQHLVASERLPLQNGTGRLTLDKQRLPQGITHFTLFDAQRRPVCERLVFVRPTTQLQITARTDKSAYSAREKVQLQVATATEAAAAQATNVSVAVYRLDSLNRSAGSSIGSYLWLTSDVRGAVEQPEYYLTHTGPEAESAADNLMLTQGWSRFTWNQVLAGKPSVSFLPELNGQLVYARVTNPATKQPVAGVPAFLAAPSRVARPYPALSDAAGILRFETHDLIGDRTISVQTSAAKDTTYQLELLNPFSTQFRSEPVSAALTPSAADAAALQERSLGVQTQRAYFGKLLTRFTPQPADSIPFFGKADEHYRLDDYTRFKVMEEVMREYVPGVQVRLRKDGYHFMILDHLNSTILQENPLVLVDGVPVYDINRVMAFSPLKVKTLDVVTMPYLQGAMRYDGIVSYTTYQGDLSGFQLNPHVLLQEYQGLQQYREFYAPRYDTPEARQSRLADFRNLLHWQPELRTSTTGTGQLEFYTSDQPGTYVVEVQGVSATGRVGVTRYRFEVKPAL
ncbi:hypothetical protein [Hymenobacter pini]|uniref:hypothetical protein n=1 Tax=Hymenobacter pini TaxID=2880879 RepID=UPI001CF54A80|nr:hypothetical protein [Hymenobacter pini]MCA8829953.1 hypothetical protein [Hymenobacter pini]